MARKKKEPDNLVEICGKTYVILDTDVSDGRVNHKAMPLEVYVDKVLKGEFCRDALVQRRSVDNKEEK